MRKTPATSRQPQEQDPQSPQSEMGQPGQHGHQIQHMQPRKQGLGWLGKIGLILIGLFIVMFILNYLLPSAGVGGCIGVISVDGEIASGSGYGIAGSDDIISFVKEAEQRPDVKGILVEINSPGGTAVASREIYLALKETKKPIVAHIGELGASGGYYVALGADRIIADPLAITGSIGVRSTTYEFSALFQKLGINTTVIKTGAMKDTGDMFRPMTEDEKELLTVMINEMFEEFKATVITERSNSTRFSLSNFDKVSDARILTGKQAYNLGLVDELGTKQQARRVFGKELGLGDDPQICQFKVEEGLFSSMFSSVGRGLGEAMAKNIKTEASKVEYR